MEKLEDRTLLSASFVGVAIQGGTYVYFFSDGATTAQDIQNDVKVAFNKDNSIASITLKGRQTLDGLGMLISSAAPVGKITDARTANRGATLPNLSFIASSAPIKNMTVKSGMTGYALDGFTFGFFQPIADIDGDTDTTDLTAIYAAQGNSGAFNVSGSITGDVVVNGNLATLKTGDLTGLAPVSATATMLSAPDSANGFRFTATPGAAGNNVSITIVAGDEFKVAVATDGDQKDVVITYNEFALGGRQDPLTLREISNALADSSLFPTVDAFLSLGVRPTVLGDDQTPITPMATTQLTGGANAKPVEIIVNGQSVTTPAAQTAMNLGVLQIVDITSQAPIKSIKAIEVTSAAYYSRQKITAPSIGSITTTGRRASGAKAALLGTFQEDVKLTSSGRLNTLTVAGVVQSVFDAEHDVKDPVTNEVTGHVASSIGTMKVGGWNLGEFRAASVDKLISTEPNGYFSANVFVSGAIGDIKMANVTGGVGTNGVGGHWTVGSIKTFSAPYIALATINLTQPYAADQYSLGKLTVQENMEVVRIVSVGNIGDITTGGLLDSNIFAGVQQVLTPKLDSLGNHVQDAHYVDQAGYSQATGSLTTPDGVYDFPLASQLTTGVKIKSLNVLGHMKKKLPWTDANTGKAVSIVADTFLSVQNSNIAADHVGTVMLTNAKLYNDGIQFGMTFNTYDRIRYQEYSIKALLDKYGQQVTDPDTNNPYYAVTKIHYSYTYPTNWLPVPDDMVIEPASMLGA